MDGNYSVCSMVWHIQRKYGIDESLQDQISTLAEMARFCSSGLATRLLLDVIPTMPTTYDTVAVCSAAGRSISVSGSLETRGRRTVSLSNGPQFLVSPCHHRRRLLRAVKERRSSLKLLGFYLADGLLCQLTAYVRRTSMYNTIFSVLLI